jgi:hypothetical protein
MTIAVLIVASEWFPYAEALACPACNIHNYLGVSVRNAANIYVGQLVLGSDGSPQAEVVRVIRGNYLPGQRIAVEFHEPEKHLGTPFVFCEGEEYGPRWKCLEIGFEQEVRFLAEHPGFLLHNPDYGISMADEQPEVRMAEATAEGNPVKSNAMAVQCLQFVSVDGVEAAKAYFRGRRDPNRLCIHFLGGSALLAIGVLAWRRRFRLKALIAAVLFVGVSSLAPYMVICLLEPSPVPLLQQALGDLAPGLQKNSPDLWDAYRHANLLGMLHELAPYVASRYADTQCSIFFDAREREIEWKNMLLGPSPRAGLICDVVTQDPTARQRIIGALGQLGSDRLMDASYALSRSKALSPGQLLGSVGTTSLECAALGVFQAGQEWAWQWARNEARAPIEMAAQNAQRADFRERIQGVQATLDR